jgi:hypothetical protein
MHAAQLRVVRLEMQNPPMTHIPFHIYYQAANKAHMLDVTNGVARAYIRGPRVYVDFLVIRHSFYVAGPAVMLSEMGPATRRCGLYAQPTSNFGQLVVV